MGAVKSIRYQQGTADGADVYLVTFEHGKAEWTIWTLNVDDKMEKREFRVL